MLARDDDVCEETHKKVCRHEVKRQSGSKTLSSEIMIRTGQGMACRETYLDKADS